MSKITYKNPRVQYFQTQFTFIVHQSAECPWIRLPFHLKSPSTNYQCAIQLPTSECAAHNQVHSARFAMRILDPCREVRRPFELTTALLMNFGALAFPSSSQ